MFSCGWMKNIWIIPNEKCVFLLSTGMMVLNGFKTPKKFPGLGMIHSTKDMRYALKKKMAFKWAWKSVCPYYFATICRINYISCLFKIKVSTWPSRTKIFEPTTQRTTKTDRSNGNMQEFWEMLIPTSSGSTWLEVTLLKQVSLCLYDPNFMHPLREIALQNYQPHVCIKHDRSKKHGDHLTPHLTHVKKKNNVVWTINLAQHTAL